MAITYSHQLSSHEVKIMDLFILHHLMPRSCLDPSSTTIIFKAPIITFTTSRFVALTPVVLDRHQAPNVVLI